LSKEVHGEGNVHFEEQFKGFERRCEALLAKLDELARDQGVAKRVPIVHTEVQCGTVPLWPVQRKPCSQARQPRRKTLRWLST
jgi:hypothetical protein